MNSVWVDHYNLPHFESLDGSIKTDVLIIGGGMAGVLFARFLHEKGVDYTLVEGRTIGSGITKDTTAKITAQHGLLYAKLLRTKGEEAARKYLDVNLQAVKKYTELCKQINCDFETKTSYIYSRNECISAPLLCCRAGACGRCERHVSGWDGIYRIVCEAHAGLLLPRFAL